MLRPVAATLMMVSVAALVVGGIRSESAGSAASCPVAGTSNWIQIDLDTTSSSCAVTLPGDIAYFNKNTTTTGGVANDSTIDVVILAGAKVVGAFFLYGGGSSWAPNNGALDAETANFGPVGGAVANYNGDTAGAVAGPSGAYFNLVDVTSVVQAELPVDSDINNDPDHPGTASFHANGWRCANTWLGLDCAWQLAVIWALPDAPLRSVAFYFGGDWVQGYNPQLYFELDSVLLPPGTVPDVRVYNTAHDADGPALTAGGGRSSMKIGMQTDTTSTPGVGNVACPRNPQGSAAPAMYQNLVDTTPPPQPPQTVDWRLVRLSEYENAGASVGTTASYANGSPVYSDLCLNLDGNYLNWDWESTFAVSVALFEPDFSNNNKVVANCGKDPASTACAPMATEASAHAQPGDVLEYTITVENAGPARGGADGPVDDAEDVFIRDIAPAGTTYVPNSVKIDNDGDGTFETSPTDGVGDDQAEAGTITDPTYGTVTAMLVRLGTGAGTTSDMICYNGFVPPTYPDPYPIDPAKAGTAVPLDACGGGTMTPGTKSTVKFRVQIPADGTVAPADSLTGATLPAIILDNDFTTGAVARTAQARVFRRFSDFDDPATVGKPTDMNKGVVVDGLTNVMVEKESDVSPDPDFATAAPDETPDLYIAGNWVEWTITVKNGDTVPPESATIGAGSPSPTPTFSLVDTLPPITVIDYATLTWGCVVVEAGTVYPDLDSTLAGVQSLPAGYPSVDYNTTCGSVPAPFTAATPTAGTVTGTDLRLASQGELQVRFRAQLAADAPTGAAALVNQGLVSFDTYLNKTDHQVPDLIESAAGLTDNSDTETDGLIRAGDLAVTKGDDHSATAFITPSPISPVIAGGTITYEIRVKNPTLTGIVPTDDPNLQTENVNGALLQPSIMHPTVIDTMPGSLLTTGTPTWTCTATGTDSVCGAASGTGALVDTPTVGANGEIVYTVTAFVDPSAPDVSAGELVNSVVAQLPDDETDLNFANNVAADVDDILRVVDVSITKDDTVTEVVPGGSSVTYSIVVANDGTSTAHGLAISDVIPGDLTGATWTCTPNGAATCGTVNGTGNVSTTATIPGGTSVTIQVTAQVRATATGSGTTADGSACVVGSMQLCNTATVAIPADTGDIDLSDNAATDIDTLTPQVDVALAKNRVTAELVPGLPVTYELVATSNGPSAATTFEISDPLPAGMTLASASGTGFDCAASTATTVSCLFTGSLAATQTATVTVLASTSPAMAPTPVTNTATVTIAGDTDTSNDVASDTATPVPSADLGIIKEQLAPVVAGENVTYRLTVTNAGPSAADGVYVEDALPAGLTFVSANSVTPGWSCTAGAPIHCDFNPASSPDLGAAAGSQAVVEITASVDSTVTGSVTNQAVVAATSGDPDQTNNLASVSEPSSQSADLTMTKVAGAGFVAGETGTFTLTVTNTGPSDATAVVVTDPIPAGMTLVSAAGAGWTCSEVPAGVVRCTRPTLAADTSADITVTFNIASALRGEVSNTASVTSSTPDPGAGNNGDTATKTLSTAVDVGIVKTSTGTLIPGGRYTWTLAVTNSGPSTATTVQVADSLPGGVTAIAAGGSNASCTISATKVDCTIATLAVGATETITVEVAVDAALVDAISNTATVKAAEADGDPSNDSSTNGPIEPAPSADLAVHKSHDSVVAGSVGTWTIVASNLGPSDARDVVITDDLPAGISFVAATGNGMTCTSTGSTVTCTYSGSLAPGAQAIVSLQGTVDATMTSSVTNHAETAGSTADPSLDNNAVDDLTEIDRKAIIAVTDATITNGPVVVGEPINWAVSYRNLGTSAASEAKLTVELSEGQTISDVRIMDQGSAIDGSGTVWNGEWACTQDGLLVTCTAADFPAGYAASFEVESMATAADNLALSSTATGSSPEAASESNATAQIAVEPAPVVTTTTVPATTTTAAPGETTTTTTTTPTVPGATVTTVAVQVLGQTQIYSAVSGVAVPGSKTGTSIEMPLLGGGALTVLGAGLLVLVRTRRRRADER